jgi:hypothetical protein
LGSSVYAQLTFIWEHLTGKTAPKLSTDAYKTLSSLFLKITKNGSVKFHVPTLARVLTVYAGFPQIAPFLSQLTGIATRTRMYKNILTRMKEEGIVLNEHQEQEANVPTDLRL